MKGIRYEDIAQAVNREKRWLAETGDKIGESASSNADLKHQIRLILDAAREETESLVLIQFLRYQAARNKNWHKPRDVERELASALELCREKSGENTDLTMALIRQLLTYTYRSFVYHAAKSTAAEPI